MTASLEKEQAIDFFFMLLRWFHSWPALPEILYYFNFIQTPFLPKPAVRSGAVQKLVPRALWWFRC